MDKLKSLFIIFLLLIFISLVMGAGIALISTEYAAIITGILLILSSLSILTISIHEFKPTLNNGTES